MSETNNPKKTLAGVYRFGLSALTLQFDGGIFATPSLSPVPAKATKSASDATRKETNDEQSI